MSKDRELLKDFAAEWNKKTFQTGQNFINMKDIDSFLASRSEEKEEKQTEAERRDAEYKPCCFVCKYFGSKSHHDLMWCRDCQKYDHFEEDINPNNQ